MTTQYVKVKKIILVGCLTCPLCSNLLRDATTICVCLHTFCKECIYEKFEDDETNSCPICDIYLGSFPQEKLRSDNNLQDVRTTTTTTTKPFPTLGLASLPFASVHDENAKTLSEFGALHPGADVEELTSLPTPVHDVRMKLFPLNKPKQVETETGPAASIPLRRKERSLSSIVINSDPVSVTRTSARAKTAARKAGSSQGVDTGSYADKCVPNTDKANPMDRPNKPSTASKRKRVIGGDISVHMALHGSESSFRDSMQKNGMDTSWDRLNFLAETADRTKEENSNSPFLEANKMETKEIEAASLNINKRVKKRGNGSASTIQKKESDKVHPSIAIGERTPSDSKNAEEISRSRKPRRNRICTDRISDKLNSRLRPIWFALFACEDRFGSSFPQIPKCYIRIKDGDIPVSYIKQYLVQKLNLAHEFEVEVTCCGQSVEPSFSLHDLVDIWINSVKKSEDGAHIAQKDSRGRHIPEYVMVLNYRRKPE